jgi:hypothetical protein
MTSSTTKAIRLMLATVITALVLSPVVARADVVLDWNAIMQATVSGQPPFPQARFAAITQLAVFEAVNAITGDYKPYLGTITAPAGASAEAAAVAAAHAVLRNYFPGSAASLDAARVASLALIADSPAKSAGIAVGEAAAAAIIAARANDGSGTPEFYLPSSSNTGEWQLTPGCPAAGGTFLHWRNVTAFGIRSADQFRLDAPPALTSIKYARDYIEVKSVGGSNSAERPQDRADVARFYAVVPPVQVWNPVARQIAAAQGKSLPENARAFALLNMAMSDAAVATFDTKYYYNFWRPETAIHMGDTDSNPRTDPDPSFAPFITTPCFPSYASAHAAAGGAAREALERIYGRRPHTLTLSTPAVPGVTLNYRKLKEITDDIDDARVYGGIHFRFDQEAGADQGRRVGEYVYKHSLVPARACNREEE